MVATCRAGTAYPSGGAELNPGFSGVCFARSVGVCVMFCRSLSICPFSFGHFIVCPSIYGF